MADNSLIAAAPHQPVSAPDRRASGISVGAWGLRSAATLYLLLLVGVPILVVIGNGVSSGLAALWNSISNPVAVSAIWLTVWTALVMTVINTVFGTLTAYVLVRYRFPGRSIFNVIIDLPFAIPTLVTGVMLVLLYGPQSVIGSFIEDATGRRVIFETPGIILALLFISYPFVIRSIQPVLVGLNVAQEEAAVTLGASSWETFRSVIFPAIRPAIVSGALLSFARALGEFGSIIIVAGNIPMRSQTATTYIYTQVEAGDMPAASGVSLVLIAIALLATILVDVLLRKRRSDARN